MQITYIIFKAPAMKLKELKSKKLKSLSQSLVIGFSDIMLKVKVDVRQIKFPMTFFNGKRFTCSIRFNPCVKTVWRNVPFLNETTATVPLQLFDHCICFKPQESLCFESKYPARYVNFLNIVLFVYFRNASYVLHLLLILILTLKNVDNCCFGKIFLMP